MARIKIDLQPAFVLHPRPMGETSLLLDIFSRDHGRVGLVAKGARTAKSRWHGSLQPFQPLLCSWSGRGELGTLTGLERQKPFPALRGIPLYCGLYINELVTRCVARQDPHEALFQDYQLCLGQLIQEESVQAALRRFELALLQAIGFGMELQFEALGMQPVDAAAWYTYDPEAGPRRVARSGEKAVPGKVLLALAQADFSDNNLFSGMRRLLQSALRPHLGNKPMQSQKLLRSLLD